MAPIHDTDVAKERWAQAEWREFELWEKLELHARIIKRRWIIGACIVFVLISAIPPVQENIPKWKSLAAARELSHILSNLREKASIDHTAYRLYFTNPQVLEYRIEKVENCESQKPLEVGQGGRLTANPDEFSVTTAEQAKNLNIPGVVQDFCYDPLAQVSAESQSAAPVGGIGVIPVNDLANQRLDRASFVLWKGTATEISFE